MRVKSRTTPPRAGIGLPSRLDPRARRECRAGLVRPGHDRRHFVRRHGPGNRIGAVRRQGRLVPAAACQVGAGTEIRSSGGIRANMKNVVISGTQAYAKRRPGTSVSGSALPPAVPRREHEGEERGLYRRGRPSLLSTRCSSAGVDVLLHLDDRGASWSRAQHAPDSPACFITSLPISQLRVGPPVRDDPVQESGRNTAANNGYRMPRTLICFSGPPWLREPLSPATGPQTRPTAPPSLMAHSFVGDQDHHTLRSVRASAFIDSARGRGGPARALVSGSGGVQAARPRFDQQGARARHRRRGVGPTGNGTARKSGDTDLAQLLQLPGARNLVADHRHVGRAGGALAVEHGA